MTEAKNYSHQNGWELVENEGDTHNLPQRRVANAMKKMNDILVRIDAPTKELSQVAEVLEEQIANLEGYGKIRTVDAANRLVKQQGSMQDLFDIYDSDPWIGRSHPSAPRIDFRREGNKIIGETVLGDAFQGPFRRVHGGIIAGIFDILLARSMTMIDRFAVTGKLDIRYMKGTPLYEKLHLEAEVVRDSGRKIIVQGFISADGVKTAEAKGVFIDPSAKSS
ncbi:MAG: PaaI family thioesterase [Pseudomonadales bacterium]|nr:PaaI family thioesterase [Pseudomonadales bacterium]